MCGSLWTYATGYFPVEHGSASTIVRYKLVRVMPRRSVLTRTLQLSGQLRPTRRLFSLLQGQVRRPIR